MRPNRRGSPARITGRTVNPQHRRRSTPIGVERLERRQLLALFGGTPSAVFLNPVPSSAVITGVGTSSIAWGDATFGTPPSSLNFSAASNFDVDEDQVFSLGNLTFFNGTIAVDTGIDAIDFRVTANVATPSGVGPQDFSFRFDIINSPNTGDPIGDSDSVFLPSGFFSRVFTTPDGSQFTLELVGFGSVSGSGYSTISQFFVQESASASAQLLGRFVRVPDLTATSFSYRVPADATGELNGPVAANAQYVVTATVKNQGQGRAGTFKATVYLSSDSVIDPRFDIPLQSTTVAGLAPGASTTITLNMAPPSSWPAALPPWSGVVTIGLVIDPDRVLPDGEFANNQNQGVGIDTRPLQLYDPIPPTSVPATGLSYRDALLWMFRNGFHPVPPGTGSGWSRALSSSLNFRSAFDGELRSGLAYRQNAFIQPEAGGTYRIFLQGTEFIAEPNPETAIFYGLTWFNYVADWHPRY